MAGWMVLVLGMRGLAGRCSHAGFAGLTASARSYRGIGMGLGWVGLGWVGSGVGSVELELELELSVRLDCSPIRAHCGGGCVSCRVGWGCGVVY